MIVLDTGIDMSPTLFDWPLVVFTGTHYSVMWSKALQELKRTKMGNIRFQSFDSKIYGQINPSAIKVIKGTVHHSTYSKMYPDYPLSCPSGPVHIHCWISDRLFRHALIQLASVNACASGYSAVRTYCLLLSV